MRNSMYYAVLVILIASYRVLSAEGGHDLHAPPMNNGWGGFPVGSWIDEECIDFVDGKKTTTRLKQFLTDVRPDGSVSMQSFRQVNNRWIRNDYFSGSGTGARATLDGWKSNPTAEHIVYDGGKIKKITEQDDWKGEKKDDEELRIGEKVVPCKVWEWSRGVGAEQLRLKVWFGSGFQKPRHLEFLGNDVLTLCVEPEVVQIAWKKGIAEAAISHAVAIDEKLEVDGKSLKCIVWKTRATGMDQTYWLCNEIPGGVAKRERRRAGGNEMVGGETAVAYFVASEILPPDAVKKKFGPWTTSSPGAWVERSEQSSTDNHDNKSVVREKFLGVTSDGYAVIEQTYLSGANAGIVTKSLSMPLPEIAELDVRLDKEVATPLKVGLAELAQTEKMYFGKDQWGRAWKAAVGTCPAVSVPQRAFDNSLIYASLGENTVSASVVFQNSLLSRRIVDLKDEVLIGDKKIKCIKEEEVLKSGDKSLESLIWYSFEVPGGLVRCVSQRPSYDGTTNKSTSEVIKFSTGK